MLKNITRQLCLAALILIANSQSAFALDEWYKAQPLLGRLGQIRKDSISTVQDDVYFDPSLKPNQTTYSVKNYVSLKIDETAGVVLPDNFTAYVTFKFYKTVVSIYGVQYIDSGQVTTIYVTMNKNNIYTNRRVFPFDNAYKVIAKITDVTTSSNTTPSAVEGALVVENEIQVSREYNFSCTNNVITSVNTDTSYLASKGELRVSWAKDKMASEYDLEWAYVDQSALSNDSTGGVLDPRKIFANNATRVSITREEYYIPLLYDNAGILFYRVRPVQVKYGGQRVEARWSSEQAAGLGKYVYSSGHEPTLNWQSTTSFAEEGKRKSVVQYYDGSLRSRQTVTKDNTTDSTVVAETLYDYQGRPTIQILPAPSLSAMIHYEPNFNRDINNAEYDKNKYDDSLTSSNYCGTGAPGMSVSSGASQYYSPNNPNKLNGFHKFIPDAKGYPFAETRYTQDGTGRISKQGGVGIDLQIGRTDTVYSDSHETRYYYGGADPEDLDALFGTEAGNASHYFKNMVRDANGQYSVSYVDMHGRTIATALAGKPMAYMDSIKSSRQILVTKKLLDSVSNIRKATSIESSKSLVVTKTGLHSFSYSLNPDSLKIKDANNNPVCYDCLYNLTITITDDCNNQSLPGNQPYVVSDSNFTLAQLDTLCNTPAGFNKNFSLTLKEGTYLITKTLSINKSAQDYYRDSIYMVRNSTRTLSDFITQQKQVLASIISCQPSCARCAIDTFRNWSLYRPWYMTQTGIAVQDTAAYQSQAFTAFNNQQKACDQVCDNTTETNSTRQQMLADVTPPYGQYANPDAIDENSIFAPAPSGAPDRYRYSEVGADYYNEAGQKDSIVDASGVKVYPRDLSKPTFIDYFKDSWANTAILLHPEYAKLALSESAPFAASSAWDERLKKITTYQQAKDSGFLNPLGYTDVIAQPSSVIRDPFFDYTINPAYASTWRGVLNDSMRKKALYTSGTYLDIWSLATAMVQCDTGQNACYVHYSGNQYPFDIDPSCAGSLDMAWRYFKTMYQAKKAEIISKILGQAYDASINIDVTKHFLNFPNLAATTSGLAGSVQGGKDSLNNFISSSCRGYVAQWWNELAPCNYTTADTAILFPRLVKVCQEGGDADHPFGASTVKSSSANPYRSFDDVIRAYNDSLRAAPDHRDLLATTCNAYLISGPAPNETKAAPGNMELWGRPDSCMCTTINQSYQSYLASTQGDANFSAWLYRTTGTQMSNATLDSLRNLCNGTITCKYLVSPITVPPALQCGQKDVCVSCETVATTYRSFQAAFPGITPAYDNTDSTQRVYNSLFEKFMNNKLGFGKLAVEYLQFMDTCHIQTSAQLNTAKMLQYVDEFRNNYYNYGRKYDSSGVDTMSYRVSTYTNPALPYSKVFHDGVMQYPDTVAHIPNNKRIDYDFYRDSACVDGHYSIEFRIKDPVNPASTKHGLNMELVFDNRGGTLQKKYYFAANALDDYYNYLAYYDYDGVVGHSREIFNVTEFKQIFSSEWKRVKFEMQDSIFKFYINDTLLRTLTYPTNVSPQHVYGIGFISGGNERISAAIDWVKMYDKNGKQFYFEDFNDPSKFSAFDKYIECPRPDCATAFTQYYNSKEATSYSNAQIDSLYVLAFGQSPSVCNAPDSCAQNRTFIKSLSTTSGSSSVYDMSQTRDGGHISTGTTTAFGAKNVDVFVTKTDARGDIQWSKTFGKAYDDYPSKIIPTRDGGYVLVGTLNSNLYAYGQIWVLKLDKNGNQQWSKAIQKAAASGGTHLGEVGISILQTSEGQYVVTGHYQFAAGYSDQIVLKLDASGNQLWNRIYGLSGSDQAGGVVEEGDSLVVSGLGQASGTTYYDGLIYKISKGTGALGWVKKYDVQDAMGTSNWFFDVFKNNSGYSVFAYIGQDYTGNNVYGNMIRIDSNGVPRQTIKVARADASIPNGYIYMSPTADQGFVVAEQPNTTGSDIILQKTDSAGNMTWTNRFLMNGTQSAQSVIQNADGSYAIGGTDGSSALLIKTNSLGQTLCHDSAIAVNNTVPTISYSNSSFANNTTATLDVLNVDSSWRSAPFTPVTSCLHDPCAAQITGPTLCGRSNPIYPPVALRQYSACDDSTNFAITVATMRYQAFHDSIATGFDSLYQARCLNAYKLESFTVTQPMSEFHYTLYYYDQAGNLVRTVPPDGVDMSVFGRTSYFDSVKAARANGTVYKPNHTLKTNYRYNSLNQVVAQTTPDAGLSSFWYDRLGRLVVSQNAKQKAASATEQDRQYSYTQYDWLGRISEVGQINNTSANGAMSDAVSRNGTSMDYWLLNLINRKEQVTRTFYDIAYGTGNAIPLSPANLRNRVAYSSFTSDASATNYNQATFYSYDILGNVDTLLQDYGAPGNASTKNIMNSNGNRFIRIQYNYDLISGKVNTVAFNPRYFDVTSMSWRDPLMKAYHRYSYDAENRLTLVETSTDSVIWEKDARYEYYKHGPLARILLGDQLVQGIDYAYTIQGWLKGMNSTTGSSTADMGEDGKTGGQNINIGRDLIGYGLDYFGGDYSPINQTVNPFPNTSGPLTTKGAYRPLYNGNISSMAVNIKPFNQPFLYNYKYDQLNRMTAMDTYMGLDTANNNWSAIKYDGRYRERVSYDGNGNIKTYDRFNYDSSTASIMDKLTYNYLPGTNKLNYVQDNSGGWMQANYKIKNQSTGNYAYDEIGNLTQDLAESIPAGGIKWNAYGKILEERRSTSGVLTNASKTSYTYDASGNRIGKKVTNFGSSMVYYTWYARDAQGNIMAVYTANKDTSSNPTLDQFDLMMAEYEIYGSSRLGLRNRNLFAETDYAPGGAWTNERGSKLYELTNHLGNVLGIITDRKVPYSANGSSLSYYLPEVNSVADYYPFGMRSRYSYLGVLPLGYRFGFNGKENDDEVKGGGNQQDYGMRIYDPRLGRFLSTDPLTKSYPWYTPYQFAGNMPIRAVDLDGMEPYLPCISCEIFEAQKAGKEKEYLDRKLTEGKYTALTMAVATDVIFTKGWATRVLLGAEIFGAFEHNTAKTPEGRAAQTKRSNEALADAFMTWGAGKILGISFQAGTSVLKGLAKNRFSFAKDFYIGAGYSEERMLDHTKGVDLTKKVFETTFKKGTELEQWTYLDKNGKPILGDYYTLPGSDPTKLGIPLENRVKTTVILQEDTKFLQSTSADIKNWLKPESGEVLQGGETQLFQTGVKVEIKK